MIGKPNENIYGVTGAGYGTFYVSPGIFRCFHRVAQIPENVPMNLRKIISKRSIALPNPILPLKWQWRPASWCGLRTDAAEKNVLTRAVLARGRAD